RKSWIMIGTESYGDSFLGEVWFSEAPTPEGPWINAIKVATHNDGSTDDYSYYNPTQHPFFDQEDGRIIYFDGTYSDTFSGNSNPTPLYDYNEMMYRLDLAKIPNLFARLPGDYNRDGVVNLSDYIVWRNSMAGDVDLAADGNGDGFVTAADYDVWRTHFGTTSASGMAAQAIPEPQLGAFFLTALIGAVTSSRLVRPTGRPSSECRLSKG
ncbi:MAG TPA: dockerin type I repeat-containing protein, partial [Pirellulales bacterium]